MTPKQKLERWTSVTQTKVYTKINYSNGKITCILQLANEITEEKYITTGETVLKTSLLDKLSAESIETSRSLMNTRQFKNLTELLRRRNSLRRRSYNLIRSGSSSNGTGGHKLLVKYSVEWKEDRAPEVERRRMKFEDLVWGCIGMEKRKVAVVSANCGWRIHCFDCLGLEQMTKFVNHNFQELLFSTVAEGFIALIVRVAVASALFFGKYHFSHLL